MLFLAKQSALPIMGKAFPHRLGGTTISGRREKMKTWKAQPRSIQLFILLGVGMALLVFVYSVESQMYAQLRTPSLAPYILTRFWLLVGVLTMVVSLQVGSPLGAVTFFVLGWLIAGPLNAYAFRTLAPATWAVLVVEPLVIVAIIGVPMFRQALSPKLRLMSNLPGATALVTACAEWGTQFEIQQAKEISVVGGRVKIIGRRMIALRPNQLILTWLTGDPGPSVYRVLTAQTEHGQTKLDVIRSGWDGDPLPEETAQQIVGLAERSVSRVVDMEQSEVSPFARLSESAA
jgi:hypothetical protein